MLHAEAKWLGTGPLASGPQVAMLGLFTTLLKVREGYEAQKGAQRW